MITYRRAPIVEIVLDLHFANGLSGRDLERLRDKFAKGYPKISQRMQIQIAVSETSAAQSVTPVGFQMNAANGVDAILVQTNSITTSRLAPYLGWESLIETARRNFETALDIMPRPNLTMMACRTINRLDLPDEVLLKTGTSTFLRVGVAMPEELALEISAFGVGVTFVEPMEKYKVTVNCGSTEKALIAHTSFLLDIEVTMTDRIPLRFDDVWVELEKFRAVKDRVFELAITDAARELFK